MFKNNFIVTILKDGQPLREMKGREVYLPFESEYSIKIQNKNGRRAICNIKIDGTSIFGSNELIIPAWGSTTIERFLTDGNLKSGNKFKFVRAKGNSQVQDPTSPENGLVEVELWLEKVINITTYTDNKPNWIPYQNFDGNWCSTGSVGNVRSMTVNNMNVSNNASAYRSAGSHTLSFGNMSISDNSAFNKSLLNDSVEYCSADMSLGLPEVGATVEGSKSKQKFESRYFGEREYPSTVIKIWMRGSDAPLVTSDKIYCVNCGKLLRTEYKFCPMCRTAVVIE